MYNISDIRTIHLEPTSKCQARCPQCGRFDFDEDGKMTKINPLITDREGNSGCLDEISLFDFMKWFPPKFVAQLDHIYMCGTAGEPTLATDCLKILAYLRHYNPRMTLGIHTNGGTKSQEWWEKLAKLRVKATFGIDGLEDTHSLYRINTKWKTVMRNARSFINAGGHAEWQLLVFKHNEHQVYKCLRLAKKMGFKSFHAQHTTRFGENDGEVHAVYNPKGDITHYLEPSSVSAANYKKVNAIFHGDHPEKETIDCSVRKNGEMYVAGNGDVLPCCHMESCFLFDEEDIEDYKVKMHAYPNKPNLYKQTLKEIFDSQYFRTVQGTWAKDPLTICSKTCSKTCGTWRDATSDQSTFISFDGDPY